jgi:hypothetical protein
MPSHFLGLSPNRGIMPLFRGENRWRLRLMSGAAVALLALLSFGYGVGVGVRPSSWTRRFRLPNRISGASVAFRHAVYISIHAPPLRLLSTALEMK